MWKISNEANYKLLKQFNHKVIIPFFNILLEVAEEQETNRNYVIQKKKTIWKTTKIYSKYSADQQKIMDYIFGRAAKGQKFCDVFIDIVSNFDKASIKSIKKLYLEQNFHVNRRNYNITQVDIPNEFKIIFVYFFYEKFFAMDKLWQLIANIEYNRGVFHDNFYNENEGIKVCPYCDMSLTLAKSSNYVEHFLPKSKFPLLSMNAYNLISSCDACNKAEDGKGEHVKSEIISPYNKMIGEHLDFSFRKGRVQLRNIKNEKSVDNYLDLLQIKKRYLQDKPYEYLKKEIEIHLEYFGEIDELSVEKIDALLTKRDRHSPMNIALKSIIKKYPYYQDINSSKRTQKV